MDTSDWRYLLYLMGEWMKCPGAVHRGRRGEEGGSRLG